jgi:hypothetical protein
MPIDATGCFPKQSNRQNNTNRWPCAFQDGLPQQYFFGFGVDVTCERIGVRIMLWAPKVLNSSDLLD